MREMAINKLCEKCTEPCKQDIRTKIIVCPKFVKEKK